MRTDPPNQFRITEADCNKLRIPLSLASTDEYGMNGMFFIPRGGVILRCMVSDGKHDIRGLEAWEHVSVSLPNRVPFHSELCFIKDLFWEDEEEAVHFYPKKSEYVNLHEFCLHLWRPLDGSLRSPPSILVGPK